ncbi:HEPN domain-containing protein [Niabella sp. W65]|nr:HEPN domain-containing protein [Niabella sp. W65]MCH7369017.1 HEPN domain-containing protein [Niabella sp. W65]
MKPVHFSPETSEQIQQLTGIIVQLAHPDKIWLLGHTLRHEQYEGIFHEVEVGQERLAHCTLLVLLPDLANKEPHQWQDQLEQHCGALLPVTTLVLCTAGFTAWLRSGHPFALHVWRQAPVLYDADNMQIEIVPELVAPVNSKEIIKEGLSKAREFLAGAELYRLRQQYKMAAFMLHQCVEQALQALLKAGTGYHTHTHNIERLLQLCCLVSPQLAGLFPHHTEAGKCLLHLLQKAYISARYTADYKVTDVELQILTGKMEMLLSIVAEAGRALTGRECKGVLV